MCQLMERCDGHGGVVRVWGGGGGMTVVRKCDSHQEGVKGFRKVCQLMETYDGHGGGVQGLGEL